MGFGGPMQGASAIQGMGDTNAIPNPYGIDTTGHQSGLLGGVIADQKRAMAQQLFGQQNQANQTDLAEQALTLQRNQADEAAFGQQERQLKGDKATAEHDLFSSGIAQEAMRSKKISELTADQAEAMSNHYKMLQQKLDVGRQQATAIDPSSDSLPPGYIQEANKQRSEMGIDLLPDNMDDAVKQLKKERDLSLSSGPRIDAAQKAMYERQLKAQEEKAQQTRTETEVAGRENVAKIETMTQKTPDNVMASVIRRYNDPSSDEAKAKPLTPEELSSYQAYLVRQNPALANDLPSRLARLQQQMKNPNQTEEQRQALLKQAYAKIDGWGDIEDRKQSLLKERAAKANSANAVPDVPDNPQRAAQRQSALDSPAAQEAQSYGGRDSYQSPKSTPPPDENANAKKPAGVPPGAYRKYGQDPKTGRWAWGWEWKH